MEGVPPNPAEQANRLGSQTRSGRLVGPRVRLSLRDVFTLYDERLVMMLDQDDPLYPNWDQNETAIAKSYEDEDPVMVAADLGIEAHRLADRFDALQGKDWERAGTRSDGARFTIETFARYLVHDPVHHVHDVKKGYQKLASL